MFNYQIKAGTTDVSVVIRIIDSTDGSPELGVVFNTSGIDLEYRREGAASVDITEATLAALTTAHTDGGFLHIGNGYYRVDLPDAAVASGAPGVLVHGTVTGMVVIGCYIQLVAYDPFDTVRLGLTSLPNAAAEAAGGLYTRGTGAGQINQPANGMVDANVVRNAGTAIVSASGRQEVNVSHFGGTAGTFTSGRPNVQDVVGTVPDSAGVTTLLSRIPSALFSGITSLKEWLGLLAGKQTGNSTARTELRSSGAGSGTFDEASDSLEALRDNVGTNGAALSLAKGSQVTGFNDLSAAQVNAEVDSALDTAVPGSPTANSINERIKTMDDADMPGSLTTLLGRITSTLFAGITSLAEWLGLMAGKQTGNATARTEIRATGAGSGTFDETADSQEAIRDRGDAAWTTGGGGSLSDILQVIPAIPNAIDLADTATVRIALMLINTLDDLPTTGEITPGTISIHRKAIGGTSWSAVVIDSACSEAAGMVYFDEVFDAGTGYAAGDSIRITFKGQKITVAANDYEITDTNGVMFYTFIREAERGTNGANTTTPPTAAAIRAEMDSNSTQLAAIVADTNELQTDWANGGRLDLLIDAILDDTGASGVVLSATTREAIADAVLGRNVAGGSNTGRTVKQALAFLRNKWTLAAGTLTVYDTDDSTVLWTAAVSTDAAADPVIGNDPG